MSWGFDGMWMAILLAPLSSAASANVLTVALAADVSCPQPAGVLAGLEAQVAPMQVDGRPNARGRYHLSVRSAGPDSVSVELREHDTLLVDRRLAIAAGDCDVLADTLAVIVAAWTWDASTSAAPAAPPLQAAAPPVEAATAVTPVASPAPRTAVTRARSASKRDTSAAASGRTVASPGHAYRFALEAAAGTIMPVDQTPAPLATARLGVELARDVWLLGVRGYFETSHAIDVRALATARHTSFELSGGLRVLRAGPFDLATLLGVGLDIVSTDVSPAQNVEVAPAFLPLSLVALRGTWRATRAIGLFASAELVLNLRRERFVSDGELVATTPRVRSRFLVGVACALF